MKTVSLHEYRLSAPNTDRFPTITQLGLIGPILQREQRKRVRAAQWRATAEHLLARAAGALRWFRPQPTAAEIPRQPPTVLQVPAGRRPFAQPTHL